MNSGTEESPVKVVLDTNILISAILYEGKPGKIFELAIEKQLNVITSRVLLSELIEVLVKKFNFLEEKIDLIEKKINKTFIIVSPHKSLNVVKDEDDNRVLEAAVEGKCDFIITGDKELLKLAKYRSINIVTPQEFLKWRDA